MELDPDRILRRLRQCADELCDRCYQGHFAWRNEDDTFSHGVDEVGDESTQYAPPEPCPAGPIWELIQEIEGKENQ